MKYKGETLEDWAEKVQQYEVARAKIRIIDGENSDLVLDQMSRNITNKMIHVIVKKIKDGKL
jgi:glutamyl-tRNA reductase